MATLKETYFWVEFEETGGTISGLKNDYTNISYSFDGSTWKLASNSLSMGSNKLVYFKNAAGKDSLKRLAGAKFKFNNYAKVGGKLSSMSASVDRAFAGLFENNTYLTDASELIIPPLGSYVDYCFLSMFKGCTSLVNAPALPATKLEDYCYQYMFQGCTSLVNAPELPATDLADYCYQYMFQGCTSLVNAPELTATDLADYCYGYMFEGCTSLVNAPELPATDLAYECYASMFQGCTSLTTAPELPATTLAGGCYESMFQGCTNLVNVPSILPANSLNGNCYRYMFRDCTSLTTAPELPATVVNDRCYDGMFKGCTSLVNAPSILPATDLYLCYNCYQYMFYGCTSLVTAPELPATKLEEYCYGYMFEGCTNLVNVPSILPATKLEEYCYYSMFNGCTSLTTAPELPATTLAKRCYMYMFYHCTSLTTAPELPATVMKSYCYAYMFTGCTLLEETPILPASLIVDGCYVGMFMGCSNLGYVKMFAKETTGATAPLRDWLSGTKSEGLYIGATDISSFSTIPDYIPSNWVKIQGYPEDPNIPIDEYFWVEFENVNGVITGLKGGYSDIYYSFDCVNWLPCSDSLEMGNNKRVYLLNKTRRLNEHAYTYIIIQFTSNAKIGGYLSSLGYAAKQSNFKQLFMNNTYLTDASELILPWAVLDIGSYGHMFHGCTNLVNGPSILPAFSLKLSCYASMFEGCTSLVTAPELPATTLASDCYYRMFNGCTSLVTAPALPAATLTSSCYDYMFEDCTSLNYIKMLATDLYGIGNLENWVKDVAPTGTFVKSAANTEIPIDSYDGIPVGWTVYNEGDPDIPKTEEELKQEYFWVEFEETGGVVSISNSTFSYSFNGIDWTNSASSVSLGTNVIVYLKDNATPGYSVHIGFNKNAKVGGNLSSLNEIGENAFANLFMDKTHLIDASELILPWDTLAPYCFNAMFYGCTNLKKAPKLPATTLADSCYMAMFQGCTSLTTAPALPATTLAVRCYDAMFRGCSSLLYSPEIPATSVEQESCDMMFLGCTSLKTTPSILPAATLKKNCYYRMFEGCSSITTTPALPATTLAEYCYYSMFNGCKLLKNVPSILPATTLAKGCYKNMFRYCESLEMAPELPATTLTTECYHYMFAGCASLRYIKMLSKLSYFSSSYTTEWVYGVAPSGTFVKHPDSGFKVSGYDGIPVGWTVYNEGDPNIPEPEEPTDPDNPNPPVDPDPDEPIVPPEEITTPDIMLYKTRLDFPATGGSLSVQVDYRNATTINTPTCSQSWVSIRQSGGGGYYFEDDGSRVDQRMWVITMEETPFYRSAPIIFSCTNNVGTIFEEDKFMVYQTGPTTEDVEGDSYILVPKKEISLKEIGDSEEIIITYANVADIIAPEVPEGYEITEISRTQIDGNTIEVKYKITKIEDSKNDAKVIFKAQGKGGSEVKSDTTIKGWTPPTEPATVELPEIDLDNGVLVFEHTGGTRTIRLTIDGYTKPMNVDVTINDTNNNIHLVKNESDYDDGYDYCVWELDFESDGNTTNNPYEGTIDIHYTDGLTDKTISFPFYVRYEGEGLIKEFSNNFKFDKDGELLSMSDNIGVGYLNIMTYHIPTHPDWIIIGTPTDGGVSVSYDKVYRYPISVQPNEGVERTGIVRISGIGKDGKEYYTEVTVLQEGTNTEVIIDEGFIELQSLSVTLPAEGGSETFQVKYYDLQELLEPEFVGDWATIEKVSETSEDGVAWNGEECVVTTVTYKATAKATTYGRQAKVIFKSYINYGDGGRLYMEKDKFRVNQLAPNATGTMGTVFAFSNNITVDSRGFVAGDTIWKEARVGYKDVTIEYPVIDVNWFRIAKIVDKGSSKEYDALKYYELEFDKNLSALSRTGTITFKGKNEDGTYTTAIVRVVQLGEEPVDPETGLAHNYKGYFKSLDCTLYSVSLITQPGYDSYEEIILAGDSPVVVSYTESDRLYQPLRTSTCTIKVMSSSYLMNLYTGKAQGTQVVVKNEDTGEIEWCGFLQPNLYNQGFSAPVETIEFEASDCLNTLQYIDYSDVYSNGRFVVAFKEIIDDMMDRCKLINSYYVTQKMYSDTFQSKTMDFNNFYISEYNFYSEEEEPWKLKEVLEEICKYMGYVCFQWGDSVYFMDYDMYKEKKMNGARWDKSTRWNTKNAVLISEKANEIVADSYMGTGASMSLDDVFNSVKVNCNYYNVDDLIPDLFEDDYLTNRHGENAVISISRYGGRGNSILMNKTFYRVYDHKYINSLYYSPVTSTYSHETKVEPTEEQFKSRYFFRDFIGGNIVDMVHLNYSEANEKVGESKDLERYLMISQLNRPWCGAEGTFHWENYNFPIMEYKNIPVIFIDNTAEDETTRTATRATSSSRPNTRPQKKVPMPNYLVINASAAFVADLSAEYLSDTIEKGLGKKSSQSWYTYGGSSIDQVRNAPALCFYLEIPQAGWWNGSTWVDYKTHFEVPLDYFGEGADDNKFYKQLWATDKDVTNNIETYLFLGTTGYRIPLPKVMDTTRDMYFAIAMPKRFVHCSDSYGGDNTGKIGNAYCFIKDLRMKIVNRNTIFYENDEDEVYENVIDSAFVTEGEEIDLKITSDNYKRFSYSTVSTRTAEDVPTTDIQFYNKNMELRKPEEAIIERYVNQYSTPSIKTSLTLDMSFKPYELITDTYWKKDFVITGQEIDYQMGSQTITLLEKK